MMAEAANGHGVWTRAESRLGRAIVSLGDAIRRELPSVRWALTTSKNQVKPLHMVATFALPGREDEQLVLSIMYTSFRGSMERYCDIMREDGPIVAELPRVNLGVETTEEVIERSITEVETFLTQGKDVILSCFGGG
jgi:hypothetical protein